MTNAQTMRGGIVEFDAIGFLRNEVRFCIEDSADSIFNTALFPSSPLFVASESAKMELFDLYFFRNNRTPLAI